MPQTMQQKRKNAIIGYTRALDARAKESRNTGTLKSTDIHWHIGNSSSMKNLQRLIDTTQAAMNR